MLTKTYTKKGKTFMKSVPLDEEESRLIKQVSEQLGISIAALFRSCTLKEARLFIHKFENGSNE